MKMKLISTRSLLLLIINSSLLIIASCSPNNVKEDSSLKKYFDEQHVTGTFGLYDNGTGQFLIYDLSRFKDSAFLPASTFKIVNSLIGIETGVIENEKMVIKWDGVTRTFPNGDTAKAWNKDLTMEEAFRVSAVPYYQEVARRIGKDTMQHWLDSLSYGTKKIKSAIDTFWLDNSLKISPDEQLGIVKRLYFNQLPFFTTYQEMVKNAMLMEDKPTHILSYKTGLATKEDGTPITWIVGWIEENRHPYFFVLNMETKDKTVNLQEARMTVLRNILTQLNFFKGQR